MLAFSNDYYGFIFRATQSVELFCAYGKTYMACAFGMEACKQYYNTRYVRMPDLLMDLDIARTEGNYRKVMAKYSNPVLLILDEWMLLKPTDTEQKDIFNHLLFSVCIRRMVRSAWRRSKSFG